jgi:acetyl-CoA carboxylase biotin carboxyl carrier protein
VSSIKFDPEAIRALANILSDTGLTEIEISEKDSRVRVARAPAPMAAQTSYAPAPVAVSHPPAAANGAVQPGTIPAPADLSAHPGAVTSPMVGVAYLSAEPGALPFVMPGQAVSEGQTLLLIEAMKTYNQIKAPKAGTVSRILVNSGSPVEYGEVLMLLDP